MNRELELKLQAWVDGELSGREEAEIARLAVEDPAAQSLAGELRGAKSFLRGNEPEYIVPETREFYWSKIQREIERDAQAADPAEHRASLAEILLSWRRFLAPAAGFALVAFLAVGGIKYMTGADPASKVLAEVENLSEHTSSFSFRSQSENMFVVWVQSGEQEAPAAEPDDSMPSDDMVIQ